MTKDWRSAFLAQAGSDYDVARALAERSDIPVSHALHYLQMTAEKVAKGFQTAPGAAPIARSHVAFVSFVRAAGNMPQIQHACKIGSRRQFSAYVQSLLPLASVLERLAPALAGDGRNAEYPWEHDGQVTAPVEEGFLDLNVRRDPRAIKLMQFISCCVDAAREEM